MARPDADDLVVYMYMERWPDGLMAQGSGLLPCRPRSYSPTGNYG